MRRSNTTLKTQFQQDVDAQLQTVMDTAPARRWARLEDMAENGHAGAAAIMGSMALDDAVDASPVMQFFGAHIHNYEIAYENLRRYQVAGGDVDVSADIARAVEALPQERITQLDASVQEWGAQYAPATPAVTPEAEPAAVEPEAETEVAEAVAEALTVDEIPAEEIAAEEPVVADVTPEPDADVETAAEADAPAEEVTADTPAEEITADASAVEPEAGSAHYLVERGDTLSELMVEKYGITGRSNIQDAYAQIAGLSGIDNPDKIYANETVLTLPRELTLSNGQTFPLLSDDEPDADVNFERHIARHGEPAPCLSDSFCAHAPITETPDMDAVAPVVRRAAGMDYAAI